MGYDSALKYAMGKKGTRLYHGTARALGMTIETSGLDPEGPFANTPFKPEHRGKCSCSEEGYVYFYDDITLARSFACGMTAKVGLGPLGEIFEINSAEVSVEKDPLLPRGSYRHKGKIPANKLKVTEIMNCEKIGMGKKQMAKWYEIFGVQSG